MKKQYIQPDMFLAGPEYDMDFMIPVGSTGVDDGFAKVRENFDEEEEEEAFLEELSQQSDKKTLW